MMRLRDVVKVLTGQETSEGAGVRLKRMIGTSELDHLDPFLLLDEFKSEDAIARYGPFVMNTGQEIKQAIQDLEDGTFLD